MKSPRKAMTRKVVVAGALVLAGFGGGAALATGGLADAATSVSKISAGDDEHGNETPLTGTTATKVRAAALAKYPGATVDRVETDADGVYEAHIVTKAGDHLVVQVNKTFKVTGTETFAGHGPGHGPGRGPGPGYHHGPGHDGDGPDDPESSALSAT